jgi:hypothetical protein
VRQVVFTDVLIVGRLDVDGQIFAPIGLHKKDAASDWLLINGTALVWKACREASYKINRITSAISVILALPERRCFISAENQRCLRKIQKPAPALIMANICQFCVNIVEIYLMRQSL